MSFINIIRKLAGSIVVIMIASISIAAPAKANVLRDIEQIGVVTGVVPMGCGGIVNGARNMNVVGAVWRARCYQDAMQRQRNERQMREDRNARNLRQEIERRNSVHTQLSEACRLGDKWSCERIARMDKPVDPRVIEIVRRLEAACNQGDRASCQRLNGQAR